MKLKKCCICKKIVLPWQQSKISISTIHLKCHKDLLSNMNQETIQEIQSFEELTGINSGLLKTAKRNK